MGSAEAASAKPGAKCSKAGQTQKVGSTLYTCVKVGGKLVWNSGTKTASENVNQSNARRAAASYLNYSAFSRVGLIKQLEYEGYSHADAVYGTDAQNADWNAQAAKAAKSYLEYTAFSRSGLIEQLKYEGYTESEAIYGVNTTGLK